MLNKIFTFLGFNSTENLVGLSQLKDNSLKVAPVTISEQKKELKLSDLMRGN